MAATRIVAPPSPEGIVTRRIEELRVKRNRTAAEAAELLDLLADGTLAATRTREAAGATAAAGAR